MITHPLENEFVASGQREHPVGQVVELDAGEPLIK
jgi:hypothetical protein